MQATTEHAKDQGRLLQGRKSFGEASRAIVRLSWLHIPTKRGCQSHRRTLHRIRSSSQQEGRQENAVSRSPLAIASSYRSGTGRNRQASSPDPYRLGALLWPVLPLEASGGATH